LLIENMFSVVDRKSKQEIDWEITKKRDSWLVKEDWKGEEF